MNTINIEEYSTIQTIDEILKRFENIKNIITLVSNRKYNLREHPILFNNHEDLIFFKNNFIRNFGLNEFNEFQESFILNYRNQLKSILDEDLASFSIYKENADNIYEIIISINQNNKNHTILRLNPYLNLYESLKNIYKEKINMKIKECEKKLEDLKESEKVLDSSTSNIYFSSENPFQLIDMTFRKKKYKEKLKNKIVENSSDILEYKKELSNLRGLEEEFDIEFLGINDIKDRIIHLLTKKLHFKDIQTLDKENNIKDIIKKETDLIEDNIEFFE